MPNTIIHRELWKINATEAGTVLVKDIKPGGSGSKPQNMMVMNGMLFFGANDGPHGVELWKSDGTEAGTTLVQDITSSAYWTPYSLTVVGNTLFFVAYDQAHGYELWALRIYMDHVMYLPLTSEQ